MTAGNQPSSGGGESAFDICEMIISEEFHLDEENPPSPAIQSYGYAARDRIRAAKREVCGGAQPPRGRDHFIAEAIAESAVTPSPGARAWTPDQFWEYVGGLAGEFEADQMRDMLAAKGLSITSTTCAGAVTKHSGTFLGYRDEHGNEMHCAHAFCPHQAKCHKGCTNPVAMTSTPRGGEA